MNLKVELNREASVEEVDSLIFGTGALQWPWWGSVSEVQPGIYQFRHDNGNSEEGAHDVTTTVSAAGIVGAAGLWLSEQTKGGFPSGDVRDAITENLGYLDAEQADVVLQMAVLKEVVFG